MGCAAAAAASVAPKTGKNACDALCHSTRLEHRVRSMSGYAAHCDGLAGATVAHDEDAPNVGVYHVQQQPKLHLFLACNAREWEGRLADGLVRGCAI